MAIFNRFYTCIKCCQCNLRTNCAVNAAKATQICHDAINNNCQILSQFGRAYSQISGNNIATALRPFYFAVHPDLFGQHPTEREVNENSLKQLTAFLELIQENRPAKPTPLKFYIRQTQEKQKNSLKAVDITLAGRDVKSCIQQLLKSCDLSTNFVDGLLANKKAPKHTPIHDFSDFDDVEEKLTRDMTQSTFSCWLEKNAAVARAKLEATQPIREETEKLKEKLSAELEAADIVWDCGWDISHFKGCLQCLSVLLRHHPDVRHNLKGRTVVFGKVTGVSMDGHIILSSGDVRHSWLDLLKRVNDDDNVRSRIPAVEQTVSRVLRDIKVVHRKFQPVVTAQNYETQLRTLSASLADFYVRNGFPASWPNSLQSYQLVVESDASPLMLSPTGQFLVPSSCPSFLIVDFITQNLAEATRRLQVYNRNKSVEEAVHSECVQLFSLAKLRKDDNVTPERMIQCCEQLLQHHHVLSRHLEGARLYVTHYYSVLQEGEMCLPWNCSIC